MRTIEPDTSALLIGRPNVPHAQLRGQGPRATGDEHGTRQERGAEAPGHEEGRASCYGELGSP